IDANIDDYQSLIPQSNHDNHTEVIILDSSRDGIRQITESLTNYSQVNSIQIVSHGQTGNLQLGSANLNLQNLNSYAADLAVWSKSLGENGDILVYGCNVAADAKGVEFVTQLSELTQADIAASSDLTGNSQLGGDWNLELTVGQIEADLALDAAVINGYGSLLVSYNGHEYRLTSTAMTWEEAAAEAASLGGNLVVINDAAEQNWLNQTFGTTERLWIGLTDLAQEGNFQWVDGAASSYLNWAPNEPNDFKFGGNFTAGEDYALMNWNGSGQWNDMPNSFAGTFRGVIEISEPQPPQTFTYNNRKYLLTSTVASWEAAQAEAESLGGNLVTINDAAEQGWLRETFGNTERFWIGLTDRTQEGNFQWVNGETSSYRDWAPNEPNDFKFGGNFTAGEDYTLINWNGSGQWNDMPDSFAGTFRGIIELGENPSNPGVIGLETSIYQVNEDEGTVEVTIARTEGSDSTVTVDYATVDATASAGEDYSAASGTVTFADGETSKRVTISILNDALVEGNEEFSFTIDNVTGGATLLAPRTALVTIADDESGLESIIDLADFADVTPLTLNGNALQASNVLRLTTNEGRQAGSAFFDRPLAINSETSFSTQFQFRLSGGSGGADGFTFMVQNDVQAFAALGQLGGNLGYGNNQNGALAAITKSLAIEFDTYRNPWDINNNHISVLQDGNFDIPLATVTAPFDLNSGGILNAWIDYDGDRNLLEVFLSNTDTKPATALLSTNVDLTSVVGSQAFLGFSGSTGGLTNNHDILSWQVAANSNLLPAPPSTVSLNTQTIISGLIQPTAIEWTPNGDRFYIAEKGGVIKVAQNGQLLTTPFIDISAQVNGTRDRGLLDIAVHPDFFDGSPYIYALYTYDPPEVFQNNGLAGPDGNGNRAARLTRITADASTNYTTAVPGSEVVILGTNSTWENFNGFANSTNNFNEPPAGILPDGSSLEDFLAADSESHTIGSVEFGPDGALYITNGDGTSYNRVDPRTVRVQDLDNLSGKVIRIDPITGEGLADNPFYNGDPNANRSKVYQYGLRNPFRMTIDPRNGDVFVGDVGWTQWEEINSAEPGANFGWPYYEGGNGNNLPTGGYSNLPESQAFYNSGQTATPSILALNHSADGINAIVLGDIYTGNAFPEEYQGDLFFNDLGQGIVYHASFDDQGNVTSFDTFTTGANIVVQIIEAPDGSLYFVDLDDGTVGRWFFS
ncbi:MAG: DUF4347 domain-containing protein, partial [Cyanobacteria bacterium J06558_2]